MNRHSLGMHRNQAKSFKIQTSFIMPDRTDDLLELAQQDLPLFQSRIKKHDLIEMIIDALRYRSKWTEIAKTQFFKSPTLLRMAELLTQKLGKHIILNDVNYLSKQRNQKFVIRKPTSNRPTKPK